MKNAFIALLLISSMTSCVSTKTKITPVANPNNTNKVVILPYEEYIYNGVRLMNAGDTLYLDPLFTVKVK